MVCPRDQSSDLFYFYFKYINNIHLSSDKLKCYLLADETNILYADKNLEAIEQTVNADLKNVHDWLSKNKLTLNTKNSNFVIFRPRHKKCIFPLNKYSRL